MGYSEIDKFAASVYERHFKEVKNYGDITRINAGELPDFDCLVGGFPCQAFSIAGRRAGFADTRGTLFFDLARILREKQPRLFVFENVKGLLSHDEGRTFTTIVTAIDELGYDCQWQVLNSKNHGVPQNRERVIIIGNLRGSTRPEVFPFGRADSADRGPGYSSREISRTLRSHQGGVDIDDQLVKDRGLKFVGSLNPIPRKGMEGQEHLSRAHKQPARVYDSSGINPALSAGETQGRYNTLHKKRIRRLTPRECERLQGFPDYWTEIGAHGDYISDSQRYKMCGNAVTTNVIRDVFREILRTGE